MRLYYIAIICVIVIVLGMLFYPTVHGVIVTTNTTGFLPLTAGATTLLSYAFLGFVLYAIIQMVRR